jgi:hypothetical protein
MDSMMPELIIVKHVMQNVLLALVQPINVLFVLHQMLQQPQIVFA